MLSKLHRPYNCWIGNIASSKRMGMASSSPLARGVMVRWPLLTALHLAVTLVCVFNVVCETAAAF